MSETTLGVMITWQATGWPLLSTLHSAEYIHARVQRTVVPIVVEELGFQAGHTIREVALHLRAIQRRM